MDNSGIYKITNPNGKIYIGQSTNLLMRINAYKNPRKDQPKIYASLKKYGYQNLMTSVLRLW